MIVLSLAMVALVAASRADSRAISSAPYTMPAKMQMIVIVTSISTSVKAEEGREKGDSPHLCAAPSGPFRQMGTVPFFTEGGGRRGSMPSPPAPLPRAGEGRVLGPLALWERVRVRARGARGRQPSPPA